MRFRCNFGLPVDETGRESCPFDHIVFCLGERVKSWGYHPIPDWIRPQQIQLATAWRKRSGGAAQPSGLEERVTPMLQKQNKTSATASGPPNGRQCS